MSVPKVSGLDGGYGWLVTFACFAVNFVMQGLARAAGVLYVAIIELYGVSREEATTPFSLRFGVRNMTGPIVGILAHRFGMRAVVIAGGILASFGGALCAIAPDVFWISMFWGVVHGVGYGLCNTIHVLILNQYFDKHKATSIAMALTGDCFGTFVFPSLLEFLLLRYGVDGTFLILGAICLNVIPAGMIMRIPDWLEKGNESQQQDLPNCYISQELNNHDKRGIENEAFEANETPVLNVLFKENRGSVCSQSKNDAFSGSNNQCEKSFSENKTENYFMNIRNSCDSENILERDLLHKDKVRQNASVTYDITNSNRSNPHNREPEPVTQWKDSLIDNLFSIPSAKSKSKHYVLINETLTTKQRNLLEEKITPNSFVASYESIRNRALYENHITAVRKYLHDEITLAPLICESKDCKMLDDKQSMPKQSEKLLNNSNLIPSAAKCKSNKQLDGDQSAMMKKEEICFDQSLVDSKHDFESIQQPDETDNTHKQKDSLLDKTNDIQSALVCESKNCAPLVAKQSIITRKDSYFDEVLFNPLMTESKYNQTSEEAVTIKGKDEGILNFTRDCALLNEISCKTKQKEFPFDPTFSEINSTVPSSIIVNVTHNDAHVKVSRKGIWNSVKQFLNLNIRPLVLLMGINLASYSLILIAVITIIVDYSADRGISADLSKYLIISFSVADLFGRIGFGVILDKKLIKLSHYSGGNIALMGISVLAIPFSSNYWYMMSCMILFGFMQGGNAIVYPLLVEEYMNKGEDTVALGCLNLYGGLIMLPMAPMIGFFRDTIGNYDGVFYTVGGLCVLAGISWTLEPFLLNVHQRMSRKALK